MGSVFNGNIKLSIFGESHGKAIGVVIDGFPAGMKIDYGFLNRQLMRRRPKNMPYSTKRAEDDIPEILSGVKNGVTTGSPICMQIINRDARPADYREVFRPSHADYTAFVRYGGFSDLSGGGHFSGRLTAALVMAGALSAQYIKKNFGAEVFAHIKSIGGIFDAPFVFDDAGKVANSFDFTALDVFDKAAGIRMLEVIENAAGEGDSIGGSIECCAAGVEAGLGSPIFGGIESRLSSLLFAVPAVKGVEFGKGFEMCRLKGSEANDSIRAEGGRFYTLTNNNGGVLGGISNGMPILFTVAIKPTPSIAKPQQTADKAGENVEYAVKGRHDPCIVPRAVPVAESAAAIALLDLYLEKYGYAGNR
jgi:chorismate synthase